MKKTLLYLGICFGFIANSNAQELRNQSSMPLVNQYIGPNYCDSSVTESYDGSTYDYESSLVTKLNSDNRFETFIAYGEGGSTRILFSYKNGLCYKHELMYNGMSADDIMQTLFYYDSSDRIIAERIDFKIGLGSFRIESADSSVFEYDANDNIIRNTLWNFENSTWNIYSKDTFYYDAENNCIQAVSFSWDEDDESWTTTETIDLVYVDGKEMLRTSISGIGEYSRKTEYEYDENGDNSVLTAFFWEDSDWLKSRVDSMWYTDGAQTLLMQYEWDEDDQILNLYSRTTCMNFIKDHGGSARFTKGINALEVYPNPVENQLTLVNVQANAQISIVDASGKMVKVQNTNHISGNNVIINTDNLSAGVYMLIVKDNNSIKTTKFLKN